MEFKTSTGRVEFTPQKEGASFSNGTVLASIEDGKIWLEVDGRKHLAHASKVGDVWWVHALGHTMQFEVVEPGATGGDDEGGLVAPMPGKVLEVLVSQGQSVSAGDTLMIMEAMKMEHKIVAGHDGIVENIHFKTGDQVDQGAELLTLSE